MHQIKFLLKSTLLIIEPNARLNFLRLLICKLLPKMANIIKPFSYNNTNIKLHTNIVNSNKLFMQ